MNTCPIEILELIFDYVIFMEDIPNASKDVKKWQAQKIKNKLLLLANVNKQWREVATTNHFWKPICYNIFWKSDGKIDHKVVGTGFSGWCDFRHRKDGSVLKKTMPVEDWLLFEQHNICRFFVSKRVAEIRPEYQYYDVPTYYYNKDAVKNRKPIENSSAALRSYVWVTKENKEVVGKYCRQKKHFNLGFKQYKSLLKWEGQYFEYFTIYYKKV